MKLEAARLPLIGATDHEHGHQSTTNMSDTLLDLTLDQATGGALGLALKIIKKWNQGKDLEPALQEWMLEGPRYLYEKMLAMRESLEEEIKQQRLTPEECVVITAQVIEKQRMSTSSEKKKLLAHVAINGMLRHDVDQRMRRFHLRKIDQLEVEHVEELRELARIKGELEDNSADGFSRELLRELESAGLARFHESNANVHRLDMVRVVSREDGWQQWVSITPVGHGFLGFLKDPEEPT